MLKETLLAAVVLTSPQLEDWRKVPTCSNPFPIEQLAKASVNDRILSVNSLVNNQIKYRREHAIDVWKCPDKAIAEGGDCEDYAIAKYTWLKSLGVKPQAMRLLYGKDSKLGYHVILEIKHNSRTLYLDNLSNSVSKRSSFKVFQECDETNCRSR